MKLKYLFFIAAVITSQTIVNGKSALDVLASLKEVISSSEVTGKNLAKKQQAAMATIEFMLSSKLPTGTGYESLNNLGLASKRYGFRTHEADEVYGNPPLKVEEFMQEVLESASEYIVGTNRTKAGFIDELAKFISDAASQTELLPDNLAEKILFHQMKVVQIVFKKMEVGKDVLDKLAKINYEHVAAGELNIFKRLKSSKKLYQMLPNASVQYLCSAGNDLGANNNKELDVGASHTLIKDVVDVALPKPVDIEEEQELNKEDETIKTPMVVDVPVVKKSKNIEDSTNPEEPQGKSIVADNDKSSGANVSDDQERITKVANVKGIDKIDSEPVEPKRVVNTKEKRAIRAKRPFPRKKARRKPTRKIPNPIDSKNTYEFFGRKKLEPETEVEIAKGPMSNRIKQELISKAAKAIIEKDETAKQELIEQEAENFKKNQEILDVFKKDKYKSQQEILEKKRLAQAKEAEKREKKAKAAKLKREARLLEQQKKREAEAAEEEQKRKAEEARQERQKLARRARRKRDAERKAREEQESPKKYDFRSNLRSTGAGSKIGNTPKSDTTTPEWKRKYNELQNKKDDKK